MRRITLAVLMLAALTAAPVPAQQPGHVVAMPDALKWVEPATLPGARLAVVQGDPGKEGLFVYRLKMPAVLVGVFSIGLGEKFDQGSGQELPAGGFVSIPPKHPHYAWAGAE
jgi:hypothetical protein